MGTAPLKGWHITRGGKTYGPYSWEEIVQHAAAGRITKRDKVYDPRNGAWTKPTQVPGLFGPGGAAAAPVGLATATKVAVGIVLALVLVLSGALALRIWPSHWVGLGRQAANNPASITSNTGSDIPPEGLTYKGTFRWESKEGAGLPNLWHDDACWLWIYTTDDGTAAEFNFGEHAIDGYPVFLVSQSGAQYTFESSDQSFVERVRVVATTTDAGVSGTVTKIIEPNSQEIGSFVGGTFSGTPIIYDQYRAEVID